jgi:thioredoxin reductase
MMYDILIIGAGPAGISAGIYAVSRGKRPWFWKRARWAASSAGVHRHPLHRH